VIGSAFGGSVTALRATEKGYCVGVLESGGRWPDSAIPKSNWDITKYLWQPGKSAGLSEGTVNPYYLGDLKRRVSVARVAGKLYGFGDLCTYEGCQLSAGKLTGTALMCPCDGSRFDIATGGQERWVTVISMKND
jgi:nitrite reductase/ring-hydroxylating ferredoxin subunit